MSYFAVHYTYVTDSAALDAVRPQHRAYLATLIGQTLVASGPYLDVTPPAALLLFKSESRDEVVAQLDADPFWVAGLISERSIQAWNPVLGELA